MRLLLTGGGTAGHINPALAIADTVKKYDKDAEIAYVGTPAGMENRLVEREGGYHMYHVDIMGIRRSLSPSNLKAAYLALVSPLEARKILKEFKPDIVVGTGGYVSWPVLKAAAERGIPCAVHEANSVPGLAVRMLKNDVDCIFINFEETAALLGKSAECVHVGCPLRESFYENMPAEGSVRREGKVRILCYGGSLGAEMINRTVLDLFKNHPGFFNEVDFTLATGERNYDTFMSEFSGRKDLSGKIEILPYIYDMQNRMADADIVVSRSGAITLCELALMKKCAVLIPSPNVTDDQQRKNAGLFARNGAAEVIDENDLTTEKLYGVLADLAHNPGKRSGYEKNIEGLAVRDSNKRIYDKMIELIEKR